MSELVVPVLSVDGSSCVAVLDVDSNFPAAFDEVDKEELEAFCVWLTRQYHSRQ
jgi:GAF domain-containing protein